MTYQLRFISEEEKDLILKSAKGKVVRVTWAKNYTDPGELDKHHLTISKLGVKKRTTLCGVKIGMCPSISTTLNLEPEDAEYAVLCHRCLEVAQNRYVLKKRSSGRK